MGRETSAGSRTGFSAMKRLVATAALAATTLVSTVFASAEEPVAMIEWPYVGAEQAHTKYSAADEITAANVGELEIAWRWEPNEMPLEEYGTRPGPFQATPIMVGNVLYLSTMYTRVAALDAETGAELWVFNPKAYEGGPKGAGPRGFKHRGIAYWSDGDDARIFLNSRDRLQRKFDPPGTVQAFDVRTGERRWVFFTIPQSKDDFGADSWEDESWRYTGHANVWG